MVGFKSKSKNFSAFESLGISSSPEVRPEDIVRTKLVNAGVKDGQTISREMFNLSNVTMLHESLLQGAVTFGPEVAEVNIDGTAPTEKPNSFDVKVKLIFVDIGEANYMVHQFLRITHLLPKYGRIHTGIAIGSKIIEWNNSALCVPRACASSKAILAIDIASIPKDNISDKLKALSEVIVDWNVNRDYSVMNGNCQTFVDASLSALSISTNFDGLLGEYIASVRKNGSCEIFLRLPEVVKEDMLKLHGEEFIKELGFETEQIVFENHTQLDDFTHKINEKFDKEYISTRKEYLELFALLKAFDRGFWLRHRKGDSSQECSSKGCPFGDPGLTATNWQTSRTKLKPSQASGVVVDQSSTSGPSANKNGDKCVLQ